MTDNPDTYLESRTVEHVLWSAIDNAAALIDDYRGNEGTYAAMLALRAYGKGFVSSYDCTLFLDTYYSDEPLPGSEHNIVFK